MRRLRHLAPLTLLALLATLAVGQAPASRFDAASIKLRTAAMRGYNLQILPGGRLRAENVTLTQLIEAAYHLQDFQVAGVPAALKQPTYDVTAEAGGSTNSAGVRARLQTLLAERFHLAAHMTTRNGSRFALVIAKGGPKLTPAATPDCSPPAPASPAATSTCACAASSPATASPQRSWPTC